jgi:hypothetical protein
MLKLQISKLCLTSIIQRTLDQRKPRTVEEAIYNSDETHIVRGVTPPTATTKAVLTNVHFGSGSTTVRYWETACGYYIQPTGKYYKSQFELFFGFGIGNAYFDADKTVYVPK